MPKINNHKENRKKSTKKDVLLKEVDIVEEEKDIDMLDEDIEVEDIDESELDDEKLEKDIEKIIDSDDIYVGDSIAMFFQEMKKYPLLTIEREKALVKIYATGSAQEKKRAKEVLMNSNMRLVVYNANKYKNYGIPFEDLIQEGFIGLSNGIDKFDYKKGLKLSTYVTFWIRQAISRYICNNGRAIRLPVHITEKLNKYKKAKAMFINKNGYEPDNKTMARALHTTEEDIEKLISYTNDTISLDKNIGEDEDSTIGELVADRNGISPEEFTEQSVLRDELDKIISTLKPREQQVIRMRYGLNDEMPQTLEVIGNKLNVTRERIRQIEALALRKLKHKAKYLQEAV